MLFVEGPSETGLLDIYLTTFFGVRKIKDTSAMRVTFFWKCSKLNLYFKNGKKYRDNVFFVSDTIASENVAINCLY